MPCIISIEEAIPPYEIKQENAIDFARELFSGSYKDIERLLKVFENGQIKKRYFARDIDWFKNEHSLQEKNDIYIETAVTLGKAAIEKCLTNSNFLKNKVPYQEIDAIFYVSTTGFATPSIEARIMNLLPFSQHTKRIPIWGLGCAGGASGLSRAFEYCLAFPKAKVLVLSVELCSLTFQKDDLSKSNLIGTSIFADGVACALVCGDEVNIEEFRKVNMSPYILATHSTLMPNSLDVMGWDMKDKGLFVIFSRDIPHIIEQWLKPNVTEFLKVYQLGLDQMDFFIAHPGGKKVLEAYETSLGFSPKMTERSLNILENFGNMSSATILYVLKSHMEANIKTGSYGLGIALGPGFSSELLLMRWE